MSRAFTKESDSDAGEPPPELAISPHPNFVTPGGLQQIEARVTALEAELRAARAANEPSTIARVGRDLRYWAQRRASARVVPPQPNPEVVRFGVAVTVQFDDDSAQRTFRLVGEDEAEPANGLISWVSPLAKALTGKAVGDAVEVIGRAAEIVALAAGLPANDAPP